MLKNPLPLSFVGRPDGDKIFLNKVLVVHKFPVPFHLSTKADPDYIIGVGGEAFSFAAQLRNQCRWKHDYRRFFPQRYHSHPYFHQEPNESYPNQFRSQIPGYPDTSNVQLILSADDIRKLEAGTLEINGWKVTKDSGN